MNVKAVILPLSAHGSNSHPVISKENLESLKDWGQRQEASTHLVFPTFGCVYVWVVVCLRVKSSLGHHWDLLLKISQPGPFPACKDAPRWQLQPGFVSEGEPKAPWAGCTPMSCRPSCLHFPPAVVQPFQGMFCPHQDLQEVQDTQSQMLHLSHPFFGPSTLILGCASPNHWYQVILDMPLNVKDKSQLDLPLSDPDSCCRALQGMSVPGTGKCCAPQRLWGAQSLGLGSWMTGNGNGSQAPRLARADRPWKEKENRQKNSQQWFSLEAEGSREEILGGGTNKRNELQPCPSALSTARTHPCASGGGCRWEWGHWEDPFQGSCTIPLSALQNEQPLKLSPTHS